MERNYRYYLDKEGRIWHEGTEITDPRFALLILRSLQQTSDGQLLAKCQGENCFLEAEDVPYIVQDVAFHKDSKGNIRQVDLFFSGGYTEILDPRTLTVSAENVLYCRVRSKDFSARFTRKAFFKLAPFIEEDPALHTFYLNMNQQKYPIGPQGSTV